LEIFQKLNEIPTKEAVKTIVSLGRSNNLTKGQIVNWIKGYSVEQDTLGDTAFTVINGLTRAAQEYDGDSRFKMESLAGEIMTPSLTANEEELRKRWNSIYSASELVRPNILEQYVSIN
jgi:hypothetical protein